MKRESFERRKSAIAGAATLYLVATACASWAIHLPGIRESTYYIPGLTLIVLGFPASLFVYKFPWSRYPVNLFLIVGIAACVHLGFFLWATDGSQSVFWPYLLFIVLGSTAYYRDRWPLIILAVLSVGVLFSPLAYERAVTNLFWGKLTIQSLVILVSFVFGRWMFESIEQGSLQVAMLQRGRNDFLLAVAHQLKTPLTSLRVTLDLMKEAAKKKEGSTKDDNLVNAALRSEQRIEKQLERIFEFFRLRSGDIALEMQAGDMEKLVNSVLEFLRPQIETKKLRITLSMPFPVPKVMMDTARIETVLMNLLQNAVDFSPVQGEVRVSAQVLYTSLLVKVKDSGPGVSRNERNQIFEAFHRGYKVPAADTRSSTGMGLGLAIAKSIVELHKGKVWVESEQGEGAEFCFSLPLTLPPFS